jgi:mannose-1-phosphate guanylyltransferase
VHVLSAAILDRVPPAPFECDINRHVYPPLMASGAVRGFVASGYWNDLGTPGRYLQANRDALEGRIPFARFPGADPFAGTTPAASVRRAPGARLAPGAVVEGPALVLDGAEIGAGATLGPGAVVGAGARVPAGAVVRRAVVWEGTALAAGEVVEDAIAAGADRVGAGGV